MVVCLGLLPRPWLWFGHLPSHFTFFMNKSITSTLIFAALLVCGVETRAQAQAKPASQAPRYKDAVGENPTADADIQVVAAYLSYILVAGNTDKAKMLLADNYRGYGPGATDSVTRDKAMAQWQQHYKTQLNRKVRYEGQTAFQVKTGRNRGNWVATWGEYTFTQAGKTLQLPFHYIAHMTNGKIDVDRTYVDNLAPSLALGYKLTPPAATAAAAK